MAEKAHQSRDVATLQVVIEVTRLLMHSQVEGLEGLRANLGAIQVVGLSWWLGQTCCPGLR